MDSFNAVIRFFQEGGAFMYPILLFILLGIAIAIERFLFLNKTKQETVETWTRLQPLIQKGRLREALNDASSSPTALGKVLTYGLARTDSATHRDDIETAMEEGLMEVIPSLEKRTHYLATFANVAMLFGLLGTVAGLIDAFAAVANAEPSQKAELLSASIAVGMNCTAFGLGSAIPMMLMYSFLQSKTTQIVDSIEMGAVKFLNMLHEKSLSATGIAA